MAIQVAKLCPRKAYLQTEMSSGIFKAGILRKISKETLLDSDFTIKEEILEKKIDDAFLAMAPNMFEFEAAAEGKRMKALLWRYVKFERNQSSNKILSQSFKHAFKFLGEKRSASAHRLIDRGDNLECIRYVYKAPNMSYDGRTVFTMASCHPDLLALQKCGELEAKKLGIKKPVFASFYYLKSKTDRTKALDESFEAKRGNNIISHHFSREDEANIADLYKETKPEVSVCTEDDKKCSDCRYADLCHLEFNKRTQVDMPVAEELVLNEISMTKHQERFVRFDNGECRVNAVAGSGKTTIVTLRTLHLIEQGCLPEEILLITFTDKAKGEMQSRLRRYAHGGILESLDIDVDKIVVETFNSFGQNMLTEHFEKLGFTRPPELIDEVVKKDIIVKLLEGTPVSILDYCNPFLDMPNASGAVVQMGRIIDTLKANHVEFPAEAEDVLTDELKPFAADVLKIYKEYNVKLIEQNLIDYADQLRLLMQLQPYGVFEALPFKHIMIDEFQDSDPNQINLIMEIARADEHLESLVVVGDELQAIYGFRNATPENLLNFGNLFPGMIDIPMEDNFRSQSPIIAMANRILAKEARIAKAIRCNRKEKGLDPVVLGIESQENEQDLYVKQIKKFLRTGTAPQDIAVLCRTKNELIALQKKLDAEGVPTILRVPEVVANASYVKAIIGLAAFLHNHECLLDFALYYKSLGQDPFDTVALKKTADELSGRYDALTEESERILLFTGLIQDASGDYIAAAFVEEIMTKGFHTANQIFQFCIKYRDYGVKDTKSTAREDVDAVTLITVHSAKGLEWPVVLLSLRTFRPANEEEHRLLYVAITRAKEKLLITHTKKQETLVSLLD